MAKSKNIQLISTEMCYFHLEVTKIVKGTIINAEFKKLIKDYDLNDLEGHEAVR